jgi:hypothetical protein
MEKEQTKIMLLLVIMVLLTIVYAVFSGIVICKFRNELDNSNNIHYTHKYITN